MNIKWIAELVGHLLISRTTELKNSSKSQPSPLVTVSSVVPEDFKEEGGYYIWTKGYTGRVSDHFGAKELTCHCKYESCKEQRISADLITRLEKVRVEVGQPLIITSAYRCTEHQAYIRSSGQSTVVAKKSTHETGDAVDVLPKAGMTDSFTPICAKQFDSIGLAKTFLHLDTRVGFRRWNY